MFKRAASVFLLGSLSFAVSSMQVSASVPMFLDSNIRLTEFLPRQMDGVGSAVNLSESVRNDRASSMQVSASLPMQVESRIPLTDFLYERRDGIDYTMTFGESTHNIISYSLNLQYFVVQPIINLISYFKNHFTLCTVEGQGRDAVLTGQWVCNDNTQLLDIASRISAAVETYESTFTSCSIVDFDSLYTSMKKLSEEITSIYKALNNIADSSESRLPTEDDVKAGKCKDFKFLKFPINSLL